MFHTMPASAPPNEDVLAASTTIPLSVLSLDLPTPDLGWPAYLSSRDIAVVEDSIGRQAVSASDARVLISEYREHEARKAELLRAADEAARV